MNNSYTKLLILLVVSSTVALVGIIGMRFKIEPLWFAVIGAVVAFPTAVVIVVIEGIAARARKQLS